MDQISGTLSNTTGSLSGSLSSSGSLSGELSRAVGDHTILTGRDAPNQHPIPSITNLETAMTSFPSEAMSNADILAIMST